MKKNTYLFFLGLALRENREALKYSQEGFSDTYGLGRRYYGDLERGIENVSVTTLERIAEGLQTTPAQLMVRAEEIAKELQEKS